MEPNAYTLCGVVLGWFLILELGYCSGCGWFRLFEAAQVFLGCGSSVVIWVFGLPLTRAIEFRAMLQKGNRVQVPKLVRWEFKLERSQVLKVAVGFADSYVQKDFFFGRMNEDERITIPKLTLDLLVSRCDRQSLVGSVLQLKLEPSGSGSS